MRVGRARVVVAVVVVVVVVSVRARTGAKSKTERLAKAERNGKEEGRGSDGVVLGMPLADSTDLPVGCVSTGRIAKRRRAYLAQTGNITTDDRCRT